MYIVADAGGVGKCSCLVACGLVWLAGFIDVVCFVSLLTGSGLISLILFSLVVAVDGLGRNVIGVVLASFGSMLLGVLLTGGAVDIRMPVCLASCSCFGLLLME